VASQKVVVGTIVVAFAVMGLAAIVRSPTHEYKSMRHALAYPSPSVRAAEAATVPVDTALRTSRVIVCDIQQATIGFSGGQQVEYFETRYASFGITFIQAIDSLGKKITLVSPMPITAWRGQEYMVSYDATGGVISQNNLMNLNTGWHAQGFIRADGVISTLMIVHDDWKLHQSCPK
jgi:hypothetical protein